MYIHSIFSGERCVCTHAQIWLQRNGAWSGAYKYASTSEPQLATDEVGSRELNRMEMFLLLAICLVNLMYLGASAAPLQPVSCCVSSTSSNIHSACEICTCSLWCKILQLSDVSLQTPSPTVQVGGKDSFQDFSNIHLPTTSVGLCNMLHGALSGGREFRLTSHEAYNTLYCGFIMRLFPVV